MPMPPPTPPSWPSGAGKPSPTEPMDERARGLEMLRPIAAAFARHDLDAIMAHFTDGAVFETPRGTEPRGRRMVGTEAERAAFADRFAGIPDVRYREDDHFV